MLCSNLVESVKQKNQATRMPESPKAASKQLRIKGSKLPLYQSVKAPNGSPIPEWDVNRQLVARRIGFVVGKTDSNSPEKRGLAGSSRGLQ